MTFCWREWVGFYFLGFFFLGFFFFSFCFFFFVAYQRDHPETYFDTKVLGDKKGDKNLGVRLINGPVSDIDFMFDSIRFPLPLRPPGTLLVR